MAQQEDKEGTMARYEAKLVKCPFYKRNENNRVVCEGLGDDNKLHLVFSNPTAKSKYMQEHCYSLRTCQDCLIHKAMYAKWEMDDDE